MKTKAFLVSYLALGVIIIVLWLNLDKKSSAIKKLNEEVVLLENKHTLCNAYLAKQNIEIKALKLDNELSLKPLKSVEKIEKIYIKDDSCEAELKAYKELFNASY